MLTKEFRVALRLAVKEPLQLSKKQILTLLTPTEEEEILLWNTAHLRRLKTMGSAIHLRAIIEFSNYCRQDCLYCGLRASNSKIRRYRMTPDEIIGAALRAYKNHAYGTFVLQGGEDPDYDLEDLAKAVRGIKERTNAAVTLSIGEFSKNTYEYLWKAGAERFLLKFETSSKDKFTFLKPTTSFERRYEAICNLRGLGYQVGSGFILGLPDHDLEIVADNLLFCRNEDFEMVSIGPFIPHPDTPLGKNALDLSLIKTTINVMAIARLLVPYAHIPATTAFSIIGRRENLFPSYSKFRNEIDPRIWTLKTGANVLMFDVTPNHYRKLYSIYPGKAGADGDVDNFTQKNIRLIRSLGMKISSSQGHSPKQPWGGVLQGECTEQV